MPVKGRVLRVLLALRLFPYRLVPWKYIYNMKLFMYKSGLPFVDFSSIIGRGSVWGGVIMPMDQDLDFSEAGTVIMPIKWCRYLVYSGYAAVAMITLAHIVWYFAAQSILASPPEVYLRRYIVLPAIGLLALNLLVDFLVRLSCVPLWAKEYLVLMFFTAISFYLSSTHKIATVLLGTFTMSVFASTIFTNIKMTRRIFLMNSAALVSSGIILLKGGNGDGNVLMSIFVGWDILFCSYLLAKVMILNGHNNLMSLMHLYYLKENMQEQLKLDPFTGLYNRGTFDACLSRMVEECRNANICLSLAVIDVDEFKRVNDVYGHAAGDRVLLHLAQILKSNGNEDINSFRIGGEEFAILFRGYCIEEAYKTCERMRSVMESSSPNQIEKNIITFSCGLACLDLRHAGSEELLRAADVALYEAKNHGRNRIVIYDGP